MDEYLRDPALTANERLALALITWRISHDMNQTAVALAMRDLGHEWHQATVSKFEKGKRDITLAEGLSLIDLIGITVGDLVGAH